MTTFREKLHQKLIDGAKFEQSLDPRIEAFSRRIWPWKEKKLLFIVAALIVLDFCSTYAFLELNGNPGLYESNQFARWALNTGGFLSLFFYDLAAACVLMLLAAGIRMIYEKRGFKGYGRLGFVLILTPYIIITLTVIFNNVALTFIG